MDEIRNFGLIFIGLIIFIIMPLEKTLDLKKEVRLNKEAVLRDKKKLDIVRLGLEKKEEEIQNLKEDIQKNQNKNYKFSSLGDFTLYINEYIKKNNLNLIHIGRVVKSEEESSFNYQLEGRTKDVFNFLIEVEKEGRTHFLSKPLELSIEEGNMRLEINFSARVEVDNKNKTIINKDRLLEETKFKNQENLLNNKSGILEFKNKKYYVKDGEEIRLDNKLYRIIIKNGEIKLLEGENK